MHLWCGEIYNNHIIANCLQNVLVKKNLENWSTINIDIEKSKLPCFYGLRCRSLHVKSIIIIITYCTNRQQQ